MVGARQIGDAQVHNEGAMTALRIHLLGPFEVFRDAQPLIAGDWRDWDAIRAWASSLRPALQIPG